MERHGRNSACKKKSCASVNHEACMLAVFSTNIGTSLHAWILSSLLLLLDTKPFKSQGLQIACMMFDRK